ncbi:conserved Plasmodium protein, unknown function [Plasmodium berghei]|uniref:CCAAT-box DNA binding protein subunit B n=2 Tax=Plasmodium berghei TaxID=5821 RepID=A0A509AKX6_PLABA|nr:conserved Plasmodium protein, unknown function [Plasmodium berghei ANKA]CXI32564.1 conserved Plasmodium protein, unknown function [Plasmodium berghei]SCM21148.1 conserved Plasmodium protein, unknown function [Plasmodium berghei]SCN24490.1 conserved Plasmodium protein, unknown function [Plasmodium berghei]SCO59672.1 conserved Plasmodium protein, unknown function [Plasmodium berghei]SCO60859.1 conserved Plasmodium protein, unknown function [Plasmodium berghei]|eukprot:XP_034421144.1 conserved Plasmodium protein, unknown function [Plasmodium berghei ANKA]
MLFNIKENEIKKKKILLLLFLFLIYEQCLFKFVYSFAISRRSLVLNSLGDNNGCAHVKKKKINENKKLLLDIGNSLKENDVQKSLIHLDNLLNNYEHDNKFSKSMSMLCGNVLNLCSRFNDINNMVKIIESMKEKKIEMLENSYLAICNYYISNNYIYEYLLTINKMIEKNITIRERFYKYILVRIIDLPLDESGYEKISNSNSSLNGNIHEYGGKNRIKNFRKINNNNEKYNNNMDQINVKSKRCHLVNNIDYDNFKEYVIKLNKYNINLEEEDKKYILNNYLIIDIFNHMNSNKIKIKLIYVLKLIHYVYENIQHVIKKIDDNYIFNDIKKESLKNNREENKNEIRHKNNDKIDILKNILMEQIQTILELYKNNYESMNINIKKIQENLDDEEKRNLYYCVNKIVKKIPFIKLTENIKNTYNCKNCDENINTYFLTLKQVIIAIINIILITHLFNSKEIFKIKHFFSILNGNIDTQTPSTQNENTNLVNENVEKREEYKKSNKNEIKETFQNTGDISKHFNVGTYTCLLDGANIGYNKQNVENGRFSFLQIEILKEIIKKKKNEIPLIILPKIYHYKNSLKYLQGERENEEENNSDIFIPNKTIKIKKKNIMNQGKNDTKNDNKQNDALSYIKKIFNKLDNTDVDIIKKWEKEKCLYICNYNMYDDYYYILGSLAKGNNLFNIYYYIDMLSNHYFTCENLNHNIIIDYYIPNDDSTLSYSHREILHVHNNLIYDKNTNIMVLVSDENIKMESKYISMNEQYYNDKIKKKYRNNNNDNNKNYDGSNNAFKEFEKYKKNLKFKNKDEINYEKNIFMETYRYDADTGDHLLLETQYETRVEKQIPEKNSEKNGINYSNIYIKCVKNSHSTQKPIYIYTNDKMKNHYFNEYTNFILKKWKKKSFVSFYFKQPISLDDLKSQTENGDIDINDIIHNYKLPYINLENSKLYIDDIISYKNQKIYHVKINSPGKTFLSYQNENIPFMHYNYNVVKYLCIDLSRI